MDKQKGERLSVTSLRKEVPWIENNLAEINSKPIGFAEIDLTKTIDIYVGELAALRRRFGHKAFLEMAANVDATENTVEATREAARLAQLQKAETLRKLEDTPLTRFIRAVKLKNATYDALNVWVKETPNEQRRETLPQFETLAQRRGLTLSSEQIDFATNFLRSTITAAAEPQLQPGNLLTKIKNGLGL